MNQKYPTSVRIPAEIEEKLRMSAEENERSINAEIIYILKKYFNEKN